MEQKRSLKDTHHDVVQRYCPHIGENVVLLRSADGGPEQFECLNAKACDKKQAVHCRMTNEDDE